VEFRHWILLVKIKYTENFRKQFGRLSDSARTAFRKSLTTLLSTYPECPKGLSVKKLKRASFGQHSFRVSRDYRVVFIKIGDTLELLDILSHNDFDKKYG
jgi:mRNA-degrading endonuclease RelE of RelBE toxin-antitoxin system